MIPQKTVPIDLLSYKGLIKALSGASLPEGASPNLDSVEWFEGHIRRSRGLKALSADMTGNPRLFFEYFGLSGTNRLIGITDQEVAYYVSGTPTGTWTTVGAYTGVAKRQVFAAQYLNKLIFTDNENVVQVYEPDTIAALAGLSTISLTAAKLVANFYSYVLLANTVEGAVTNAWRVRWCDTGDPEEWNAGNAGFVDLVDKPGELTGLATLPDRIFAYKDKSIYGLSYVAGTDIFSPYLAHPSVGCLAPKSLVSIGDKHFFLGSDNIYSWDGRVAEPIGDTIQPLLFGPNAIADASQLANAQGVYLPRLQEFWLAISLTPDWPTYVLRYHLPSKTWWAKTISGGVSCFGNISDQRNTAWSGLVGTWADQTGSWTALKGALQDLRGIAVGQASSVIRKVDWDNPYDAGTLYPTSTYETQDFLFPRASRIKQYEAEMKGVGSVEALYSSDSGSTWTSLGSQVATADWAWYVWSVDKVLELCRFKLVLGDADIAIRKQSITAIEKRR